MIKDEVVVNVNGNLMKEDRNCATLNVKLMVIRYFPVVMTVNLKLTEKDANHKLEEPILVITGCNTLSNDEIEVSILSFQ